MQRQRHEGTRGVHLANGLGWFSIALGAVQVLAPERVAGFIGVPATDRSIRVLRLMGLREIGAGAAILAVERKAPGVWARVAGDVVDLGLLAAGLNVAGADRRRGVVATANVAGVTALDVICALRQRGAARARRAFDYQGYEGYEVYGAAPPLARGGRRHVHVAAVTTIKRPIDDVYDFWRNFENFPRFMRHLESVRVLDDRRSIWRARAPAGTTAEWEAEIVGERENESISWRSLPGAKVQNRGVVRFRRAPGGRGTEVRVEMEYAPPGGAVGRAAAMMTGREPGQQIREDLRRLKQLLETGEIPVSDGPGMSRPAQPTGRPMSDPSFAGVQP